MKNMIFGSLLGDASIIRDRNLYKLEFTHGKKQIEYLRWKAKILGVDENRIKPAISGYGSLKYYFRYYNADLLRSVAKIVLVDGKKKVTDEWLDQLDDLSLAVWYQDDGSWGGIGPKNMNGDRMEKQASFHVSGFDHDSVEKLNDYLNAAGYKSHVTIRKGKYEVIYLNHSSTIKFWNKIAPFVLIKSKIDSSFNTSLRKCGCGEFIEEKMGMCNECLWNHVVKGVKFRRNRLLNRFGTSSIPKIRIMRVQNQVCSQYLVDPELIGSKL